MLTPYTITPASLTNWRERCQLRRLASKWTRRGLEPHLGCAILSHPTSKSYILVRIPCLRSVSWVSHPPSHIPAFASILDPGSWTHTAVSWSYVSATTREETSSILDHGSHIL
jgi:hypothetical protein